MFKAAVFLVALVGALVYSSPLEHHHDHHHFTRQTHSSGLEMAMNNSFEAFDSNRDGILELQEFRDYFKKYDTNGDDEVSRIELHHVYDGPFFTIFDSDNDHLINLATIRNEWIKFDTNLDGQVDRDEYVKYMSKVVSDILKNDFVG